MYAWLILQDKLVLILSPAKYEYRRFIDKNAFVASKLGPSRSASSVAPRTNSSYTNVSEKPVSAPHEPKTTTDIAATMFSTTKSKFQLQPRTTVLSQPFPSAQESPSYPIASVHSAPVRSEGVWADLISLQKPSTNASLPLQYQAPTTNLSGTSCSNTMAAGRARTPSIAWQDYRRLDLSIRSRLPQIC